MNSFPRIFTIILLCLNSYLFSQIQSSEGFGVSEEEHEVFYENGKRGLKSNREKKILIKANFDDIRIYREDHFDRFAFTDLDSNVGLYSFVTEKMISEPKYYSINVIARKEKSIPNIRTYTTHFIIFKNHDKKLSLKAFSTETENLKQIVDYEFNDFRMINDSLISLVKDNKHFLYNLYSNIFLFEGEFQSIDKFKLKIAYGERVNKKYILLKQNEKFGLGDLVGNKKIECLHDSIIPIKKFIICWKNKKAIVFNEVLANITDDPLNKIIVIDKHLIAKNEEQKWGIINIQNTIDVPFLYDTIQYVNFNSNFSLDEREEESNFVLIATKNKDVHLYKIAKEIKLVELKNTNFEKILFPNIVLSQNKKHGIYDKDLNLVCDFKYDKLNLWYGKTYKQNFVGKINSDLYFIGDNIPFDSIRADSVFMFDLNSFVAIRNNKYALINRVQKIETEFKYDYISKKVDFGPHIFRVGNEFGLIDNRGKEISSRTTNLKNGYADFTLLANDFIKIYKSENDSLLLDFARKITPDYWSYITMNSNLADYRGIFKNFSQEFYEKAIQVMYNDLLDFRKRFSSKNELSDLTTCGFDFNQLGEMEVSVNKLKVPVTESPIVIFTKDKTYKLKLGELLVIDGQIKSFTRPKFVH